MMFSFGRKIPCSDQVQPPAPTMVSPADQWCIVIDVTNVCPHSCSNCSRFTRLVPKTFAMDLPTFQRAVDSMEGYPGALAFMGGEPTLHPQFGELLEYYRTHWHPEENVAGHCQPIDDFGRYAADAVLNVDGPSKRAILTSLGPGYYRHYEAIQATFSRQGINTHANDTRHQALLVTRRELRIGGAAWKVLRDRCWLQRLWSSSITPKGAYFCEIAGALDMLYDSIPDARRAELGIPASGGWPIEPGWWTRKPADFGAQLGWCELCGMALATPDLPAVGEGQQVSPWHAARLKEIGSPVTAYRLQVLDCNALRRTPPAMPVRTRDWYLPEGSARVVGSDLAPRHIEAIAVSVDCGEQLARTLPGRVNQVDRFIVVTTPADTLTQEVARDAGAEVVLSDACYDDHASFNKGAMMNAGLRALKHNDWVVLTDADIFFPPEWREQIGRLVLNPGCLYYTRRWYLRRAAAEPDPRLVTNDHARDPWGSDGPWGYFQLWNMRASVWAGRPIMFPLCFPTAGTMDHWFKFQWPAEKIVHLPADRRLDVYHLWHGPFAQRWSGRLGEDATRWKYAGQTDIVDAGRAKFNFPVRGWVRRVNVRTTEEETRYYDGRTIAWSSPAAPGVLYAFSTRQEAS